MAARVKRGRGVKAWLPAIAVLVLLLALWHGLATYGPWEALLFPGPVAVLRSLKDLVASGQLWPSLFITMRRLFIGFVVAMLIGGVTAFLMARFPAVRAGLKPYLLGLQSLPSIAWVPLAILWFGLTESAIIFVTIIGSVFAVAIAFTDALASVKPADLMAARNMGSKGMDLILRVMLPSALPPLVSGTKQCWSFAWRSLVGAEIVFASIGLGFLLQQGRFVGDSAQIFAVMIATLFLGLLFEVFVFSTVEQSVRRRWGLAQST